MIEVRLLAEEEAALFRSTRVMTKCARRSEMSHEVGPGMEICLVEYDAIPVQVDRWMVPAEPFPSGAW